MVGTFRLSSGVDMCLVVCLYEVVFSSVVKTLASEVVPCEVASMVGSHVSSVVCLISCISINSSQLAHSRDQLHKDQIIALMKHPGFHWGK